MNISYDPARLDCDGGEACTRELKWYYPEWVEGQEVGITPRSRSEQLSFLAVTQSWRSKLGIMALMLLRETD